MISYFISQLESQAARYQKAESTKARPKTERDGQLAKIEGEAEKLKRLVAGG
jgi:hypothetical protein